MKAPAPDTIAEAGITKLKEHADTLIVHPQRPPAADRGQARQPAGCLRLADDVLRQGIQGISELITVPGLINLDFADVRAIMSEGGAALMAVGRATGEERARVAAEQAISSQLLDITIDGARGILFNVTGGPSLTLFEVNQAAAIIKETAHPDVNLIFGAVIDPNMGDEIRITVIATGFDSQGMRPRVSRLPRPEQLKLNGESDLNSGFKRTQTHDQLQSVEAIRVDQTDLDVPTFMRKMRRTEYPDNGSNLH